jgi:tetratricopeptide (TPR) repeat protein
MRMLRLWSLLRIGAAACALCALPVVAFADEPSASPSPVPQAEATFARGEELFRGRHFREAIAVFDAYLAEHPRDARALVMRGDAKASLDQNQAALRDYNTALGFAPEYEYGYVTRCETRLQMDDASGALADCNAAIRLDANDPQAYEDRGDVYFQQGAYTAALADYDRSIAQGQAGAYVYAARCDTERLLGRRDRAAGDCDAALTIDPKSRRGLWARGRLELSEHREANAIGDFNAYIALKPEASNTAYYFRGAAFNRLGKFSQAREDLEVYVAREPADPDGYVERAIARAGLAQTAGAADDLGVALKGYRKAADEEAAARVNAMLKALHDGAPLVPPPL